MEKEASEEDLAQLVKEYPRVLDPLRHMPFAVILDTQVKPSNCHSCTLAATIPLRRPVFGTFPTTAVDQLDLVAVGL